MSVKPGQAQIEEDVSCREMSPLPEVLAALPAWLAVLISGGQLTHSVIVQRRVSRTLDVASQIRRQSGLDDQAIEERLGQDGVALELVEAALDAGQRTENEEKRRLLALVAARALLGRPGEHADHKRTLMRTVAEIEPIDVHLLGCLHRGEQAADQPLPAESIEGWRGDTTLLEPSLGALQRAGLVVPGGLGGGAVTLGGGMLYGLSRYGQLFLEFLIEDAGSADYFAPSS